MTPANLGRMMASLAAIAENITEVGAASSRRRLTVVTFLLLAAIEMILMSPTLADMARTWLGSSAYLHGLAAAPISIWLVVRSRSWRVCEPRGSWVGVGLAAIAAAAWLFGRAANAEIVAQLAFVSVMVSTFIAVFGLRLARSSAFGLFFLIFMVPFGQSLTPALQSAAAGVVTAALNLVGVETIRDGNLLTTSAGAFEMAEACSGLRYLLAMVMAALLLGELAFRDWRSKASFVVAAVAIAIVANWVRAFLIVLLVTLTERRWGVGVEHVLLGWVFYSILILALVGFARHYAHAGAVQSAQPPTTTSEPDSIAPAIGVLAIVAVAALYNQLVVSARSDIVADMAPPDIAVSGWRKSEPFSDWRAATGNADHTQVTAYVSGAGAVQITNAYFIHDRPGAEIGNSDLHAADSDQWRLVRSSPIELSYQSEALRTHVDIIENRHRQRLAVMTLHWLGDNVYASRPMLKLDLSLQKLRGLHRDGGAIFFAAPADADATPPEPVLREFIASAEPLQHWRARIPETGD